MSTMSVRVPDEIDKKLALLAKSTDRTKSWLVNQSIQDYLAREAWQIAEIEKSLVEADSEDFVSEAEMLLKFKSWNVNAALSGCEKLSKISKRLMVI